MINQEYALCPMCHHRMDYLETVDDDQLYQCSHCYCEFADWELKDYWDSLANVHLWRWHWVLIKARVAVRVERLMRWIKTR